MHGMLIREGVPDDLDAIERLENDAFETDRLSRRSLRHFLGSPKTAVPVADSDAGLIGYAMIGFRAGSRLGRIFSLAVDGAWGRQGVGRALLAACEARAIERGMTAARLEVRADNHAAVRLYEAAGYRQFETIEDYYEDWAAALRFEKILGPGAAPVHPRATVSGQG